MPKFRIEVSAQLDNVASVRAPDDYPFFVHLLCGNCGERTAKPCVLVKSEQVDGVRNGTVNIKRSCKLCGRVSDVKIVNDPMVYTDDESPAWTLFLALDCRGNEPCQVSLSDDVPLQVTGTDGFQFDDVILDGGEFYGWDEKRNVEASITEWQIRIVKDKS